jgi:hypothetical protein
MRFGLLLVGGAIAVVGVVGLTLLSAVAQGSSTSLGFVASCAPSTSEEEDSSSEDAQPQRS